MGKKMVRKKKKRERENFCPAFCISGYKEWNDRPCETQNAYICKYKLEASGSPKLRLLWYERIQYCGIAWLPLISLCLQVILESNIQLASTSSKCHPQRAAFWESWSFLIASAQCHFNKYLLLHIFLVFSLGPLSILLLGNSVQKRAERLILPQEYSFLKTEFSDFQIPSSPTDSLPLSQLLILLHPPWPSPTKNAPCCLLGSWVKDASRLVPTHVLLWLVCKECIYYYFI